MPKFALPTPGTPGTCYLIHLDKPIAHARHYLGWSASPVTREKQHRAGNGARLLAVAKARGISWQMVRTWPGADTRFERRLKNTANAARLCPECNPGGWARQMADPGKPERKPPADRKKKS